MCGTYDMNCGTCALVTFISGTSTPSLLGSELTVCLENKMFVANLGDSRAVLGLSNGLIRLSEDHKPGTQRETSRIQVLHSYHSFLSFPVTFQPLPSCPVLILACGFSHLCLRVSLEDLSVMRLFLEYREFYLSVEPWVTRKLNHLFHQNLIYLYWS